MNCPDWCSCTCHVPDLLPLVSLWIYGFMFAMFLTVVLIQFMRMKADSWYLDKDLLRVDPDDKIYDNLIQWREEEGNQEAADEYRQEKVERAKRRERTKGKAPLWLRGFYTPRSKQDGASE